MNASAVATSDESERKRAVGEAIRRARESRRLTGAQLAKRASIRPGTLSDIENGKSLPDLSTLLAIGDALGMTLDDVVGRVSPAPIASPMLLTTDVFSRLDGLEQRQAAGLASTDRGFAGVEQTFEHLTQLLVARNVLTESERAHVLRRRREG